jgi:hypothetical protein
MSEGPVDLIGDLKRQLLAAIAGKIDREMALEYAGEFCGIPFLIDPTMPEEMMEIRPGRPTDPKRAKKQWTFDDTHLPALKEAANCGPQAGDLLTEEAHYRLCKAGAARLILELMGETW